MPSTAARCRCAVPGCLSRMLHSFLKHTCGLASASHTPAAHACAQVLDHFMTEVGQRFSTRTEERLLAVVYTLQQRTYKTGLPATAAVPDVFKKELAGERQTTQSSWLACPDDKTCQASL